jgi:sulfonate transport system ATP-binding protein
MFTPLPSQIPLAQPLLNVVIIEKNFDCPVLRNIRLALHRGERLALVGASGCGKTTLLRIIAGLDQQYRGEVRWNGTPVTGPSPERGLLFQEDSLFPWMTVEQNLAFALPKRLGPDERRRAVQEALQLIDLEVFADKYPEKLSGGMLRRVALARTLIPKPQLLMLDEPFTGVDYLTKGYLYKEIVKMMDSDKTALLIATHDIEEAVYFADRVLLLGEQPTTIFREVATQLPAKRQRQSEEFRSLVQQILESLGAVADTPHQTVVSPQTSNGGS